MAERPHTFLRGRLLVLSATLAAFLLALVWQAVGAQDIAPRPPDLSNSTKSVDRAEALPGDALHYVIEISNEGTDPDPAVTMTDALPGGLELITDSVSLTGGGTVTYTADVITWSGAVNNGVSIVLAFEAQLSDSVVPGDWITNTAMITGSEQSMAVAAATQVVESADTMQYMPFWSNPIPMPPVPSLAPIGRPSSSNEWTLNWSVTDNTNVTSYTIEESHAPNFATSTTYDVTGPTHSFNHPPSYQNTYYYRVRANGPAGASDWSQVRTIIGNYRDDFGATFTDWRIRRQDLDDTNNHSRYENDHFVLKIGGRWDYGIAGPMAMAPNAPFAIETSVRMEDADNLNSYGLIWGADWNGEECGPAPDVTENCFNHYYRLNIIWFGNPTIMHFQLKRVDFHDARTHAGRGPNLIDYSEVTVNNPSHDYQVWRVEHHPNGDIKLYINGNLFGQHNDSTYLGNRYFGVFASSDEYLGSEPHFDWYTVTALD